MIQIFKEKGKSHKLDASEIFVLDEKDSVFAFEGAPLNLFALKKEDGAVRQFLGHFTEGLVFGLKPSDLYEIVAVPEGEATLYECSLNIVQPEKGDLQKWAEILSKTFDISHPPGTLRYLSSGETLALHPTDVLVHKKGETTWIKVLEGKIDLYGKWALGPEDGPYPVTAASWFTTNAESKIQALDLIDRKEWQKSFETFSRLFSLLLPAHIEQKDKDELELRMNRIKTEEENLFLGFRQLIDVFRSSLGGVSRKGTTPLERALFLIAHVMKIKLTIPRADSKDVQTQIESICEASKIQKRRVFLEQDWWREDHGPLLAFYGEEPVALIFSGSYKIFEGDRSVSITAKLAKNISPDAFMFYIPFDNDIKTGKDVFRFICENHYRQWLSIIPFSLIGAIYALFPPIATKLLIQYAIPESNPSLMFYLTCGLLFASVGFAFFYFLRGLFYLRFEGLGSHLLTTALYDRLLKLSPGFFRRFSSGNLFSRLFAIEEIRSLLSVNVSSLLFSGFFSFIYLAIMIYYSPFLSFLTLGLVLFGFLLTMVCSYLKVQNLTESLEIEANMRGSVIQMIQGVGKLRVAGVDNSAFAYWTSFFSKANTLRMKAQHIQNIVTLGMTVLPTLSTWIIYLALMEWIAVKGLSLADFLAFNIAFGSFSGAVYPLNSTLIQVINILPLWKRAEVILAEPIEKTANEISPGLLTGDIRIDNIAFGYDPAQPPILHNVSLVVKPQEFIGIVGKSGCGKSTLVRLLLGFEKPSSGVIFYDGKDLSTLNLHSVRQQMGVVLQNGGLMAGSLYELITAGGRYSQEELDRAFQLSGFDQDLATFPMGVHTFISMNGGTLSGGQKQRFLLARALLGNPSILIFDEATSALDNQSQDKIVQNIESLNVTRIAIAQRLSTIKKADRIYVIDQGTVVQQGTFAELASLPGLFSEMIHRQKL